MIHHADGIAYGSALLGDRIVPVLVAIAERVVGVLVGTEPEGALPTGDLPEASPLGSECVVERGLLHRTGGGPHAMRERGTVLMLVHLPHPSVGVGVATGTSQGPVAEAARIPRPDVPLGVAAGDHLGQDLAGRCGVGDTDLHADRLVEALDTCRRTDQRIHIRRVGDGTVDELGDTDFAQQRDVRHRQFGDLGDAFVVRSEQ